MMIQAKRQTAEINWTAMRESLYTGIFLIVLVVYISSLSSVMGLSNFFSTLMNTAYGLLIDTALYILAISVIMGAVGKLLAEFRIIDLLNMIFAPFMKPLYNLPGASFLGMTTTYLSDNPAIIVLANDRKFTRYFKKEQIPCLCNFGTSFGMGLILTTFMIGLGFVKEPLIGNLGAVIGSIVSVRLMNLIIRRKGYFKTAPFITETVADDHEMGTEQPQESGEGFFTRFMTAMLEGGKNGVDMGLKIIPGLLFVCTLIMTLTFGASDPAAGYQGLAYEGIALLPRLGDLLSPILKPLFGFASSESIAFPITSLGAVGAAISLVPRMLDLGLITGNDIAVFTAMGMCWSGYLSTHVGMMDALNHRKLIPASIFSHTIGGLVAGISAHLIYVLLA